MSVFTDQCVWFGSCHWWSDNDESFVMMFTVCGLYREQGLRFGTPPQWTSDGETFIFM